MTLQSQSHKIVLYYLLYKKVEVLSLDITTYFEHFKKLPRFFFSFENTADLPQSVFTQITN